MADEVIEQGNESEGFLEPNAAKSERLEKTASAYDWSEDDDPPPPPDPNADYDDGYDDEETSTSADAEAEDGGAEKPTHVDGQPSDGEEIPAYVLEQAEMRGLSKDDVLKLKESGLLEKLFPADADALTEDAPDDTSGDEPSLDDLELSEEYDPVIREAFGKQKAKIADLEARLNELAQVEQERRVAEQTRQIDALFEKHSKDLGDVLGTGSYHDLKPDTPAFKARVEVLKQVDVLAAGYAAKKAPVPPLEKLMEQAINVLHGPALAAKQRQQIKEKLKQNAPQFVGVASRRSPTQDLNPEAKALKNLAERLKTYNL